MDRIQILIIDLGSQYTKVIARTLAEMGYRTVILPPKKVKDWLKNNTPKAIILSGGSAGVGDANFTPPSDDIFCAGAPILGICLGMQWLAEYFGGKVVSEIGNIEYGETKVVLDTLNPLFVGMEKEQIVWASHGDSVQMIPSEFQEIARSNDGKTIAAMWNEERQIFALQFHPEVVHTLNGKKIFENFAEIAGCDIDWLPGDVITEIQKQLGETIRPGEKAVIAFSGGVDSTTLAAIASQVLWQDLLAVCIDTGALRKNEIEEIKANAKAAGVRLKIVKAAKRFQEALGNATHSEVKRNRFKKLYAKILAREVKLFGALYLIQGTLNTDKIESGQDGQAAGIKGHHNIGNEMEGVIQLHPFQNLFKYEVRWLAEELHLPKSVTGRQPFPGPGLFIRIVGLPAKPDKLSIVRWADHEVTRILKESGVYDEISQLVVALDCVRTVGIKGDKRSYAYSVIVRAVTTTDFMTARGYQIPAEIRREISAAVTKHPRVVRALYDETHKPPATTELE